jgi:hypothetical protein
MVYAVSDYRVLGFTTSTLGLVLTPVHIHRHTVYNPQRDVYTDHSIHTRAHSAPDDKPIGFCNSLLGSTQLQISKRRRSQS